MVSGHHYNAPATLLLRTDPRYPLTGGWLGLRANVDALGKERSLAAIHGVCHSAVTEENGQNKVIKELLNNTFSLCPLHNKLRILNKGRPTPPLPIVIIQIKLRQNDIRHIFASLSMKCLN
jgi:hypothetical protein